MDEKNSYIFGRNSILEALKSDKVKLEKIFMTFSAKGKSVDRIYSIAKKQKIQCVKYDNRKFKELEKKVVPSESNSQGVIALLRCYNYVELDELVKLALEKDSNPIIVVLDSINDPHNLGAIARTSECVGVAGLILSERDSAPVTPVAVKISAGALEHIPVCKVSGLVQAFEKLKERGFWLVGTDMNGEMLYYDYKFDRPTVVVIGNEGKGMKPSTKKHCDTIVTIPLFGQVNSLNASVSAGVVLYEVIRQRARK